MKKTAIQTLTLTIMLLTIAWAGAAPLGTGFTYQGRLDDSGQPANGLFDFNFKLYDAEVAGAQVGPAAGVNISAVTVTDGVFSVTLDFGSAFNGSARWLEISVNTNLATPLNALTPRQPVQPTPYALYAAEAGSVSASAVNGAAIANNAVTGQKIANATVVRSVNGLTDALTLAAGPNITLGTAGNVLTISGASPGAPPWLLNGNGGTTAANFLGTTDNQPLSLRVNNTTGLRLLPSSAGAPSVVGGDAANSLFSGFGGSVIAGGGSAARPNQMSGGYYSFIGSGEGNFIRDQHNAIGGGYQNAIGGSSEPADPELNFIGGGQYNTINSDFAVIGGGSTNIVSGHLGVIVGGNFNLVNAPWGAIGGGGRNVAGNFGAVAGGSHNIAGTFGVVAGGASNLIAGSYSSIGGGQQNSASMFWGVVAGGLKNTNSADYATVGGGTRNTVSGQDAVVAGGSGNAAAAGQSTVSGGIQNRAAASQSTVGGGALNNASGISSAIAGGQANTNQSLESVIAGGARNFIGTSIFVDPEFGVVTTNRSSQAAILGGDQNRISSAYSGVAGGIGNEVYGDYGFIGGGIDNQIGSQGSPSSAQIISAIGGGSNNRAGASGATIAGGERNVANGLWSIIPGGVQAETRSRGQLAFAAGQLDRVGDAQASIFVLRRRFSGNGDLFLDGNAGTDVIRVPSGAVWTLRFQISGVSVTGTNFASYEVSGMIVNLGGVTTFRLMDGSGAVVGTARPIFETPGAAGWLATPYVAGNDGILRMAVFAGETVKWCARIDVCEVTR